jgi:RND family efflux transporter MFP subunit
MTPAPAAATAARGDEGYLGIVVAPESVDLTSQLEARVVRIAVRPGDFVRRGDVVAQLDTRSARQELAMARAEVAAAETDRDRTAIELEQADERLRRRQAVIALPTETVGAVSDEEKSTARYQRDLAGVHVTAAEAAVAAKQARYRELRTLVDEGVVRAPFDGRVAVRYVDVGALIRRGTPLVRLIGAGELRVRFAVPEDAPPLEAGTAVRVVVGKATFAGTVQKVAPEIDAAARMIFAEAALDDARAPRLRSGAVAHVLPSVPVASAP